MARFDITGWVIHFIHDRNSNFGVAVNFKDEDAFDEFDIPPEPDGFSYTGEPIYLTDPYEEEEYGLSDEADAFEVLTKILHDGYLKAGWSYRKNKPTIYGPKAAVCFTEMPLYGLIEYARSRQDKDTAQSYGIAFMKDELFAAGARQAIYGLSGEHSEAGIHDPFYLIGQRTLSSDSGIGLREQYRYVYTKLDSTKYVNWTHEREWRWADLDESYDVPGMPFLIKENKHSFSKLLVIVETSQERETVIDQLKNLYHSTSTNRGREYNIELITKVRVLALEELSKFCKDPKLVKIDDLPLHQIPKIVKVNVPDELLKKVKDAVEQASAIYMKALNAHVELYGDRSLCGWANVVFEKPNSPITEALMKLGVANSYAKGQYEISLRTRTDIQSIDAHESGAQAAAEFLTHSLGEVFTYKSTLD